VRRVVVKVGGHALDSLAADAPTLSGLALDVAGLQGSGTRVVVVHGGGPQIAELLARVGLGEEFRQGLRVTDDATMSVVAMALSLVNLRIVAAFARAGLRAVGVAGPDDGLLTSRALGPSWGRVGEVPVVRASLIEHLWSAGVTPIVAPVAADGDGGLLNVNADTAAGALAAALRADALVMLSDVDQVRSDPDDATTTVARLSSADIREMVESGGARAGMRPKLLAALDALDGGAGSVTLASGTRAHALREVLDGTRPTTVVVP